MGRTSTSASKTRRKSDKGGKGTKHGSKKSETVLNDLPKDKLANGVGHKDGVNVTCCVLGGELHEKLLGGPVAHPLICT